MARLDLHVTAEFEADLRRLQRLRKVRTKSEAVRLAVRETLKRELHSGVRADFREWLGLGLRAPLNPAPRFASDADLWAPDRGR
jgi:hypothetical protein